MEGTLWAIIPALITIILALLFKQVYIALFVGVFTGAMIIAGGNPIVAFEQLFKIMSNTLSGSGDGTYNYEHGAILIFILMLGVLVVLMTKSGGTLAMGNWFTKKVKSRKGILGVTVAFGSMMFMDDYFCRLATGSVMRPITDRYRVSRAKLAYIIGSLSVSVCILVPISSWSSFVTSTIQQGVETSAFDIYIRSIFCNFYPVLTIAFIFVTSFLGMDFFGMRKREINAIKTGDVTGGKPPTFNSDDNYQISKKGRVFDLLLPILVLIIASVGFMTYFSVNTGDTNAAISLACGSTIAVIFALILYLPRKIISLKGFTDSLSEGFKSISDVLIILVLAWTLSDICSALRVDIFIKTLTSSMGGAKILLPAIMFLIAMATSFSTGTSWGTFGIIVPLATPMFETGTTLQILAISAVLSGAVFGDQVSPISDATILSAATARCDHMDYVKAQMPLGLMVAGISFLGFLLGGITQKIWVGWIACAVSFILLMVISYVVQKKKNMLLPQLKHSDIQEYDKKQELA